MPEFFEDSEQSENQFSTLDQNSMDEDVVCLDGAESAEPNVENNNVTYANPSTLPGIIPILRKHKKHRVYVVFENIKYQIVLFRRSVSCDFIYNATDVTFDESFTFLKEKVEFDEQLFSKSVYAKRRRALSPKCGAKLYVKFNRCMVDGCGHKFQIKQKLKV
ncbi:hypothetical protein RF11_15767 [Thelohanellus kitauei]|uniref:Uncharacterized protein n=1 Tax=Thelohanellus kitauei TaxID=669202 RepID=A0A0C2JQU5_THEKT|nr:hypothetical protein RF11_15767 [Thelohanellus kitauei]